MVTKIAFYLDSFFIVYIKIKRLPSPKGKQPSLILIDKDD